MNRLSDIYYKTESYLFPMVEEEIGEITGQMKEFLRILEVVRPSRKIFEQRDVLYQEDEYAPNVPDIERPSNLTGNNEQTDKQKNLKY